MKKKGNPSLFLFFVRVNEWAYALEVGESLVIHFGWSIGRVVVHDRFYVIVVVKADVFATSFFGTRHRGTCLHRLLRLRLHVSTLIDRQQDFGCFSYRQDVGSGPFRDRLCLCRFCRINRLCHGFLSSSRTGRRSGLHG